MRDKKDGSRQKGNKKSGRNGNYSQIPLIRRETGKKRETSRGKKLSPQKVRHLFPERIKMVREHIEYKNLNSGRICSLKGGNGNILGS